MSAIFMLYGFMIVVAVAVCAIFALGTILYSAIRSTYYKVTGQEDPKKTYEVKYKITGEYTIRVRAASKEIALQKAERFFEDEKFGSLENEKHINISIVAQNEKELTSETTQAES